MQIRSKKASWWVTTALLAAWSLALLLAACSDDDAAGSAPPDASTALFDARRDPSADAFLAARAVYQEDEGLDSRLVRRYDPHFTVPDGIDCRDAGVPAQYPDYCVGPARLQPLVLTAFNAGIEGSEPALPVRVQAARIEAALLWFLYASQYKESLTCTDKAKDCDSSYAYYTGGAPRPDGASVSSGSCAPLATDYSPGADDMYAPCAAADSGVYQPIEATISTLARVEAFERIATGASVDAAQTGGLGLARYVLEVDPYAHQRAWDGLLAVRCWRELDPAVPAADLDLRERARSQYDNAVLDGLAAIVHDRIGRYLRTSGAERQYYAAFVRTLGPALLFAAGGRDAANGAALAAEFDSFDPANPDAAQAVAASAQERITALFVCP
ncbi:MAG: hypothetical protein ACPGUV_03815 [Polyangiales bacterium]